MFLLFLFLTCSLLYQPADPYQERLVPAHHEGEQVQTAPQISAVQYSVQLVYCMGLQKLVAVSGLPTVVSPPSDRGIKRACSGALPHKDVFSDTSRFIRAEKWRETSRSNVLPSSQTREINSKRSQAGRRNRRGGERVQEISQLEFRKQGEIFPFFLESPSPPFIFHLFKMNALK